MAHEYMLREMGAQDDASSTFWPFQCFRAM